MQYTALTLFSALAGTTLAAPAAAATEKFMMAADTTWTIQNLLRNCNNDDTSCSYSFAVHTNDGTDPTACAYYVTGGSGASNATYQNVACGAFFVGSTHDASGFQVLSVVRDGLIIYPGYTDAQLVNGQVVQPDQSYTPQALP